MASNKAKRFETIFKLNWIETVPESLCYRLYDVMGGYSGISSIADFICYKRPNLYVIDCKTHAGNTIAFSDFSQYEKMLTIKGIEGVYAGTIVWFYDHEDLVVWIPIETWEKIKLEGKKSFNVKMIDDPNYKVFKIPSKKRRTYCDSDYSTFIEYCENNYD